MSNLDFKIEDVTVFGKIGDLANVCYRRSNDRVSYNIMIANLGDSLIVDKLNKDYGTLDTKVSSLCSSGAEYLIQWVKEDAEQCKASS